MLIGIIRIIIGIIGVVCVIKGVIRFTGSTDSMLDRGAGFLTGKGTGMNQREVTQFESSIKWLAAGGLLLFISIVAMD